MAVRHPRGDPLDARRKAVPIRYLSGEDSESGLVVVVRVFVVIVTVDPPNEILCRVTVFKSISEATGVLSQDGTVTEQLAVSVVGVLRFEQVNPVRKSYENFLISLINFIRRLDSVLQVCYLISDVCHVMCTVVLSRKSFIP